MAGSVSRKSTALRPSSTSGPGFRAPLLIAVALIVAYLTYSLLLYIIAGDVKDEQH